MSCIYSGGKHHYLKMVVVKKSQNTVILLSYWSNDLFFCRVKEPAWLYADSTDHLIDRWLHSAFCLSSCFQSPCLESVRSYRCPALSIQRTVFNMLKECFGHLLSNKPGFIYLLANVSSSIGVLNLVQMSLWWFSLDELVCRVQPFSDIEYVTLLASSIL